MLKSHRTAHRNIWRILVLVLPAILITAMMLKSDREGAPLPVQLEQPASSTTIGGAP